MIPKKEIGPHESFTKYLFWGLDFSFVACVEKLDILVAFSEGGREGVTWVISLKATGYASQISAGQYSVIVMVISVLQSGHLVCHVFRCSCVHFISNGAN